MVFQFKSFNLATTTKTLAAAAQDARAGRMAPVVNGTIGMLALGALSWYTVSRLVFCIRQPDAVGHTGSAVLGI